MNEVLCYCFFRLLDLLPDFLSFLNRPVNCVEYSGNFALFGEWWSWYIEEL